MNEKKILNFGLLFLALVYIGIYIWIALRRLDYPFELEWIEGGMVDAVRRVVDGKTLYPAPSIDYCAFMYPPLYFWLSALVAKFTDIGFFPLRLLSFIASLGCFVFIYLIVYNENKNKAAAVIASGLFAATFRLSGYWFDLGHVDTLFLFFLLAFICFFRQQKPGKGWAILSGFTLFLAVYTKQAALIVAIPIFIGGFFQERSKTLWTGGTALVCIFASFLWMNSASQGWFYYYLLHVPGHHHFRAHMLAYFWTLDLLKPMPVAFAFSAGYLAVMLWKNKKSHFFYFYTAMGLTGASYLFRLHDGGYYNVLFPVYACLAIMAGLALHEAMTYFSQHPTKINRYGSIACIALWVGQFGLLYYNPMSQIPTNDDVKAGNLVLSRLREFTGEVWMPGTGYLPSLTGKQTFVNKNIMDDIIFKGPEDSVREKLLADIKQAIRNQRFQAIILINGDYQNGHSALLRYFGLEDYYQYQGEIVTGDCFWPVTGALARSQDSWVPRKMSGTLENRR
jgi:hypothetical protein